MCFSCYLVYIINWNCGRFNRLSWCPNVIFSGTWPKILKLRIYDSNSIILVWNWIWFSWFALFQMCECMLFWNREKLYMLLLSLVLLGMKWSEKGRIKYIHMIDAQLVIGFISIGLHRAPAFSMPQIVLCREGKMEDCSNT